MIVDDLFEAPQPCPECGGVSFSNLILAEKKDACYYKVKASAKVWPSAYASGRLVQCRKKGADNYGNKNESTDDNFGKPATLMKASPKALKTAQAIVQKQADKNVISQAKIAGALPYQGVAEGFLGDKEYNRVMPFVKRIAGEVSDYDRDEFGEELWSLLDQKYGAKFAQSVLNDLDFYWDTYTELTGQGVAEGGEGSGRRTADAWDTSPGRVGRVEKTAQGIRHHADPSRYGGSETEPELDRLDKNKVNAMDKALGVKWDRESKRYYSPIKVDETKPKEKEADYGDDYQAMVARVKKLAGLGPLKTVYDPKKRVYRNVPTAEQPKK